MSGSFIDNGYRAAYDFAGEIGDPLRGRPVHGVRLRRPAHAGHPRGLHVAHGPRAPSRRCGRSATTSAAGSTTRRTRSRRSARSTASSASRATRCGWTSSTWTATASSPGTRSGSRTRPRCCERLDAQGFKVITIIDPGVKYEPGYAVYDQAVERDVLCRTEGGDIYIGEVWPGDTAFPDFATEEGRAWWGELNAAHVQSGLAGIWNDMNEPATGSIPPERMLFDRGRASHARFHNQYALLMAMGTVEGLERGDAGQAHVRALPRGLRRHPALRRELDGRQPGPLGPPVGEHPDGERLRRVRPAVRRRRRRRLPGRLQRRAVRALDAVRRAHAVLPQPLDDRQRRPVRVGVGRSRCSISRATRCSSATGCCRTCTPRSCARPRRASRCSGRSCSTTRTTTRCATSTTSTCSAATCWSRP